MRKRPITPNKSGLIRTPRVIDCVGEQCLVKESVGRCFPDGHHVYFPFARFLAHSELALSFYNDPHNLVIMPRCRHDQIHERSSFTYVPPVEIMLAFIDESRKLTDLGVKVRNMSEIVTNLTCDDARKRYRAYDCLESSVEWLQVHDMECEEISIALQGFEFLPVSMVDEVMRRRETVHQRAAQAGLGEFVLVKAS